jgi:hypothetical protein
MVASPLSLSLSYAEHSSETQGTVLRELTVTGPPSTPAIAAILDALARAGSQYSGETGVVLGARDEPFEKVFIVLEETTTLADLQTAVGPDPTAVTLRSGGFGGGGFVPFDVWSFGDVAELGSDVLEFIGAVELVLRVTKAIDRRRFRDQHQLADAWIRSGQPDWESLFQPVRDDAPWEPKRIEKEYGLGAVEATALMTRAGLEFVPDFDLYVLKSKPAG